MQKARASATAQRSGRTAHQVRSWCRCEQGWSSNCQNRAAQQRRRISDPTLHTRRSGTTSLSIEPQHFSAGSSARLSKEGTKPCAYVRRSLVKETTEACAQARYSGASAAVTNYTAGASVVAFIMVAEGTCGLTLGSRGPPRAGGLGGDALLTICRLAPHAPCRFRPLSSNVRRRKCHHRSRLFWFQRMATAQAATTRCFKILWLARSKSSALSARRQTNGKTRLIGYA